MLHEQFKKLFIPHEKNNFKPDFLERFSMSVMLLLIVVTFAIANIQALLWVNSDWMVSSILPAVIVELTNDEREEESLSALQRNETLDRAAQLKAEDMVKNGYFAHNSPDGVTPWYWFDVAGYDYLNAGENLAVHFTDSSEVVDGWMKSPTHRANILNGDYQEIGVGTAKGVYKGASTVFVVQVFGSRRVAVSDTETVLDEMVETEESKVSVEKSTPLVVTQSDTEPEVLAEAVTEEVFESVVSKTVPETRHIETYSSNTPTNEVVTVYTSLATTSRDGAPVILASDDTVTPSRPNVLARSATQPSMILQILYMCMAGIVVIALVISVIIEWRRQNPIQIAYASGLLAVMALLFYIHISITSGVSIV